ncbi:hypothetical protein ScPMuIL_003186 [Solemya velum]
MEAKFREHGVVSDVVDSAPTSELELTWKDGKAEFGNVLTPTQVQSPPTVKFSAEDQSFYTLIMNDPDAPSRKDPKFGEWHHWLVVNIPGGDVTKGEVMSEYVGSGPPKDTGLHRYVFLLYKQTGGKMVFEGLPKRTNRSPEGRAKHSVRQFTNQYSLGSPVAGNFYQAEFDEYVPKLMDQLSGK